MRVLHLSLLGRPQATIDGAPITGFSTAKTEALLYYLAATGRPHHREELARLFWGDMPDANAKRNLTKALSTLRPLVEPYLHFERQSVAFNPDAPHRLDVAEFETAVREGRENGVAERLRQAASLYRGDFVDGFYVKDAPDFEEWALGERERLRELALAALEALVESDLHLGDFAAGTQHARRLLELDPWRETAHRQLITLLARQGQHAAALAQYEKCRQLLWNELGVEPMPETTALHERIQFARAAKARPLPAEVEPFVGRSAELAELHRRLADPTCRLVTIVAAGGMGKTRLALALARQLNQPGVLRFLNGVVFVPLAEVAAPGEVRGALADALRVPLSGQAPPEAAVVDYLQNKELLLLLDNCEHLAEGLAVLAPILAGCPYVKVLATSREPLYLAAEWRLNLEGLAFPMLDLAPGGAAVGASFDAVQLFEQAARQVQPGFALAPEQLPHVYRLCQMTAGMPLALKLAAAWVRVMPVAQLVAETARCLDLLATPLRDVPTRQRSVRAIFESAFERLEERERRTLAALAVFRGRFSYAAAEQVAGATVASLVSLVDQALVQSRPEGMYDLHPLLRQFAAEKLALSPEASQAAHRAHSAYFLGFLADRAEALHGPGQRAAVGALGEAMENVQAAWRWAVDRGDVDRLAPVVDPLYQYCLARSRFQEGEELMVWTLGCWERDDAVRSQPQASAVLARLLARCGALAAARHDFAVAHERLFAALHTAAAPDERALVLAQLGGMAVDQGEQNAAHAWLRESLTISQAQGDRSAEAEALGTLARAAFEVGDFAPGRELASQCLALCRAVGRPDKVAGALGLLAWPTNCLGAYAESEAYWREALDLYRELGDTLSIARNVNFLGWVAWCVGGARLTEAVARHEEALITYREVGSKPGMAMCLGDLTLALIELGEGERAARCAREGLATAQTAGVLHLVSYTRVCLGAAACAQGDLPASRRLLAAALRTGLELGKKDSTMLGLYFTALLWQREAELGADPDKAARAMGLLAVVAQHPATWQPIRDRAVRRLIERPTDAEPVAVSTAHHIEGVNWEALVERLGVVVEELER